ncbi:MAG TPA: SRPBCC family protein [Actinomycetes bacterium]
MTITATQTTQVYQVFIKATPEAIWDAITKPEFTERYFYGARIHNSAERHRSLGPDGSVWGDSPTLEFDPPRRLVHGWRSLYDPELADEEPSRVSWEIEPQEGGFCKLTVTHDQLEGAPKTAASVSGDGWTMVLSGLKTLLETGEPLASS